VLAPVGGLFELTGYKIRESSNPEWLLPVGGLGLIIIQTARGIQCKVGI
jgi:hypothetical protein